jgi:hypothetical protein
MGLSRSLLLDMSAIALMAFAGLPLGFGQEAGAGGQITPSVSGTGGAGYIAIWRNRTALGNSALFQSGGRVGIGTTSPGSALDVAGDLNFSGALRFGGNILLQIPGGVPTNTAVGLGALQYNTGIQNTAVGNNALQNNTNNANTAIGTSALQDNTTGYYNTAGGAYSLSQNTIGTGNTAFGANVLVYNTTGSGNTANGSGALQLNTTGGNNTATGLNALQNNTTGSTNAATGTSALNKNTTGTDNTAAGASALYSNSSGGLNTAVGTGALQLSTTACCNTAAGAFALDGVTLGSNNIGIGNQAGSSITNTSNNIDIGNSGTAADSGAIRIGTAGIQTSAFIAGIYGMATGNTNAVPVLIDSNGNLGTVSSSRRYKEDIHDMADASSGLMRLRPVTFRYKQPFADGSKPVQYGLIAEEVAEVYPDLVARSADGRIETVKYQLLDPMLLNELQKQNATITAQQEQIRSLEERLARLEAAFASR